jgi:hypothetical protein
MTRNREYCKKVEKNSYVSSDERQLVNRLLQRFQINRNTKQTVILILGGRGGLEGGGTRRRMAG